MKNIKVLIVDDQKANRTLLRDVLMEYIPENNIYEAVNGLDGFEKIKQNHFNAVFLDIEMPEMNGLELAYLLRTELMLTPNVTKIYAITAYPIEIITESPAASCFDAIVDKPYSLNQIENLLKEL